MPSHKNPLTELRRASSVVPWIALLGRKVLAVPATSAAPERMFSSAGNIMTRRRVRLSCDHLEELMYLHEVRKKESLAKTEGVDSHQEGSLGAVDSCRPHARTHTQTHTHTQKTIWVIFPVSLLWQTINTQKEIAFIAETLSPCCTNIWTPPYGEVCIIIHPHQRRRMSGLLPFFPLSCRLSCRDPDLFEHASVHFKWTYWLVQSWVYSSSGVGLGLLLRMEKSLLTEGPWWGVLGLSVINKHLTHQGWDSDCC